MSGGEVRGNVDALLKQVRAMVEHREPLIWFGSLPVRVIESSLSTSSM